MEIDRQALTRDAPWPGLDSFDEADQQYFHGRAAETDELLRLIRREPLTVLFGRSGLGKTSLLKAGLFPRLRREDSLPVLLRIDYDDAPSAREQVFAALRAACEVARVQAVAPDPDDSLWSFFHRRDAEFWSERNRPVTPVLVFDQFEEVFTLGQATGEGRALGNAFLAELGDLVENRPPEAVRQAVEADPGAARRFDFKRAAVRLVLSFREDFLADVEALKAGIPSTMYNRFRLMAMNGGQAYDVIVGGGGDLVDDVVARRIIRLAWENKPDPPVDPADFPRIEIDPALLSVVCSELNHKRRQAAPPAPRITPALLEGADREILAGFYERAVGDLDPRVRAFVEDELITDRGYRDSEPLEDAAAMPGVTADALEALVRRRLVRIDDRQGLRRIELTHDVLTSVVKTSRDNRRAREAEAAATAREQAAREQERYNRRHALILLAGALAVTILGAYAAWSTWRASELYRQAESLRLMANADRVEDSHYALSLLVNLQAVHALPGLDTQAGLLRRFASHPHLSAFLSAHQEAARSVAWSPDGRLLASGSSDNTVMLWDVSTRRRVATLEAHKDGVASVAWSPDGTRLASGSGDKTVILWDLPSRRPLATLRAHEHGISGVAFSADGTRLASSSGDGVAIVWDVDRRQPLARFDGPRAGLRGVALNPAGTRLAAASGDKTVILWDVEGRRLLGTLNGHRDAVRGVAFSPDGRSLASAGADNAVILWDAQTRERLATLNGHTGAVDSVAFTRDGRGLASGGLDRTVILWDTASGQPVETFNGHEARVYGVAFSPDGTRVASASQDTHVILWDVGERKLVTVLKGHTGKVRSVAFSGNGRHVASAGDDATVILWATDTGQPLARLQAHTATVWGVAWSPDGKRLASASADGSVILWDAESRQPSPPLTSHAGEVSSVAFSHDGRRLAWGGADGTVIVWDVDRRQELARLTGHKARVTGVAFSPDGRRLAASSLDKTVIVWALDTRTEVGRFESPKEISSVAWSPGGKRVASARAGAVILWDASSEKAHVALEGHTSWISSIAFSPDGRHLASASADRTVILWDVAGARPLATFTSAQSAVNSVAFSPDGQRLATAADDLTLWNLDPAAAGAEACATANRNLTCKEWRDHVSPDKRYRRTCEALPAPPKCD